MSDRIAAVARRPATWAPQTVFAAAALAFGLACAAVTPPFQVPDEPAHLYRIDALARGHLLERDYGGHVPLSLTRLAADFAPLSGHPDAKARPAAVAAALRVPLNPDRCSRVPYASTTLYSPVPYAPAVALAWAGHRAGVPAIALLYLARLGTLLGYVALGWAAVRVTPVLKWPFAVMLTGPMALFLAGSASADAITTAVAFLTVAVALRYAVDPAPIDARRCLPLTITTTALALCKPAYLPLGLIQLAIPLRRPVTVRQIALRLVPIALPLLAAAAWSAATDPLDARQNLGHPRRQLAFVRHHPTYTYRITRDTFAADGPAYAAQLVGNLGWLDAPLSPAFVLLYLATLNYLVVGAGEPVPLGWPIRLLALAALLAGTAGIALATYLMWDAVAAPRIDGIQGRYFLPLLATAVAAHVPHAGIARPARWCIPFIAATGTYTLATLLVRYYLP